LSNLFENLNENQDRVQRRINDSSREVITDKQRIPASPRKTTKEKMINWFIEHVITK